MNIYFYSPSFPNEGAEALCLQDCLFELGSVACNTIPLIKYIARHLQGLVNYFLRKLVCYSIKNEKEKQKMQC